MNSAFLFKGSGSEVGSSLDGVAGSGSIVDWPCL